MNLHQTTTRYLVYLKGLGLSKKRLSMYQRALENIEEFYGSDAQLDWFDQHLVLEYVKQNDPFAGGPIEGERGIVFCKFTHWLMKNRLIPAWADEMQRVEKDEAYTCTIADDFQNSNNLLL